MSTHNCLCSSFAAKCMLEQHSLSILQVKVCTTSAHKMDHTMPKNIWHKRTWVFLHQQSVQYVSVSKPFICITSLLFWGQNPKFDYCKFPIPSCQQSIALLITSDLSSLTCKLTCTRTCTLSRTRFHLVKEAKVEQDINFTLELICQTPFCIVTSASL